MENENKVKVIEIYFDVDKNVEDCLYAYPNFILEDGRIKKHRIVNGNVFWATDEEIKKLCSIDIEWNKIINKLL